MTIEVEFRIHDPIATGRLFFRYLLSKYGLDHSNCEKDVVYVSKKEDGIRIVTDEKKTSAIKIKKESLFTQQTNSVKLSVACETEIPISSFEPVFDDLSKVENYLVRHRERYIHPIDPSFGLFLHLTKINENKYEIEVEKEYTDEEWKEQSMETYLEQMVGRFELWYTTEFRQPLLILTDFLQIFNGYAKKGLLVGDLDRNVISQPRDIEKADFITDDNGKKGLAEGYTITVKGNGVTAMFYLSKKHRAFCKISPSGTFQIVTTDIPSVTNDFIVIGEFFEKENIFTPFDMLFSSTRPNIRSHPNHVERLDLAYKMLNQNKHWIEKFFKLYFKDFIPIGKTPESFSRAYRKVKVQEYPFGNDGMILTPTYAAHNPPLIKKERRIGISPETLKIKPWEELTLDFRICGAIDPSEKAFFVNGSIVPYQGTKKYPFQSSTMVDWASFPTLPYDYIAEVGPIRVKKGKVQLSFSRLREDKETPNSITTANNVWRKINEPFEESLFLATDFSRLRFQNNRIKRQLIESIPKGAIVVDIGMGEGGDIFKYDKIAHTVLCVEPDEINRNNFLERLSKAGSELTTRFITLDGYGQESDKIANALRKIIGTMDRKRPVVVASMFSLTFFWENRKTLNEFQDTLRQIGNISPGAEFIFFTVEGKRFLNYFNEYPDKKIRNHGFRANYNPDPKYGVGIPGNVKIEIYGTIVRLQREFLVDLDDLTILKDIEIKEGVIEPYLSKDELRYGQCSVYGRAKIKSELHDERSSL